MPRPNLNAVFLGTPGAAVPTLVALAKVTDVVAVITRPDKPRGRSGRDAASPIKEAAAGLGLAVLQPANADALTIALQSVGPIDVGVVTAYGTLLRPEALQFPARGFLNVHFSLLPRWRGASPVAAAILAGDEETGVTLMHLDEGLDTGPLVAARSIVIGPDETGGELTARLATVGAALLIDHIFDWVDGAVTSTAQPELGVTRSPKLTKADRSLDLTTTAAKLARRIRALAPKPGAELSIGDVRLRVLAARSLDQDAPAGRLTVRDDRVLIGAGSGSLELLIVQPPDRRPMEAAAWLRGLRSAPR